MIATVALHHGRLFNGHKADDNMRHSKVSQPPGQTGEDFLPGCAEYACAKRAFHLLTAYGVRVRINRIQSRCVQILRSHDNHRNCQQRCNHQQALEKVGPAYSLKAAKKGTDEHGQRKYQHGGSRVQGRENSCKYGCPGYEPGGHVNGEAYKENNGAYDLQGVAFSHKPVAQVLRHCDGVSRCL